MASITDLRTAIATNLGTIVGLRTSPEMPDNPNPPIALVRPVTVEYNQAMAKGLTKYSFVVVVIVGRAMREQHSDHLTTTAHPQGHQVSRTQ